MICTKSVEYSVEKLHSLPKKSCHLPRWEYTRVYWSSCYARSNIWLSSQRSNVSLFVLDSW